MNANSTREVGAKLRQFRKSLKLTQEELGKRVGATRSQYANWESAQAIPSHYMSKLIELGFNPESTSANQSFDAVLRLRATRGQITLLVDMLYDCSVTGSLRDSAFVELRKALGLDEAD